MTLRNDIAALIEGDVSDDASTLAKYSRDKSIFERKPALVVSPKHADDVSAVVRYVHEARARGENISIVFYSALFTSPFSISKR